MKVPHEPSSILWENLDATNWQFFYRKLISSIAVTIFMIFTFLCIIGANLFQSVIFSIIKILILIVFKSKYKSSSDGECNDYTQLSKDGVVNEKNIEKNTLQYECYCISQKISFVEVKTLLKKKISVITKPKSDK